MTCQAADTPLPFAIFGNLKQLKKLPPTAAQPSP
jgi:hypothetical protein